jgi:hypothetical protein
MAADDPRDNKGIDGHRRGIFPFISRCETPQM